MDLYAENILDHYRSPRGQEPLAHADITHAEKNLSCGDALTVSLAVQNDVIQGLSWTGNGCAISQAGMSLLSEELTGKTLVEVMHLSGDHIIQLLGVPIGPRRLKCALLCLHTVKNTIRALQSQPSQLWRETVGTDED